MSASLDALARLAAVLDRLRVRFLVGGLVARAGRAARAEYLRYWAEQLGVADLLARALVEAQPSQTR